MTESFNSQSAFQFLFALACAMPRFLALFAVLPVFSRQWLPGTIRTAAVAAFALPLAPLMPEGLGQLSVGLLILVLVKEAMLGFLLGFVLAIPFWAVESAGTFIDTQRGATIGSAVSPLTGHDETPLGHLLSQGFVVFFVIIGGLLFALDVCYESFRLWPITHMLPEFSAKAPAVLLGLFDRMFRTMLLLSAPVVVAMFLSEMALALVSRFVPQLQVFFLAMPIKTGVGLLVLLLYMTLFFDALRSEMGTSYQAFGYIRRLFVESP